MLRSAVRVQGLLGVVVGVGAATMVVAARADDPPIVVALLLLPLPTLGASITLRTYLEAAGAAGSVVRAGVVAAVVAAAGKVAGVALGVGVGWFAAMTTLEVAVLALLLVRALPRGWAAGLWSAPTSDVGALVKEGAPLLLAALSVTLYMRADQVMLGLLAGDQETGIYAAAARISEVWYFLPTAALAALRPHLSRTFASGDIAGHGRLVHGFLRLSSGAGWLIVLTVALLSDEIVSLVYGPAYAPSASVLRLHVLALPFVFLGSGANPWFVDRGRTTALMLRTAAGAVVNIALNLVLIPAKGASGAAVATVAAYAVAGVGGNVFDRTAWPLLRSQARALLLLPPAQPTGDAASIPSPAKDDGRDAP